ncbi:hypothetical protein CN068_07005 [Sinorhizobium meliloti]|uniref:hypothetical protein n=1 Tax=Rhizobium meliloti TaxID=382 RepID=UPI000FDC975E|nr:hypothetical protein [Sinorhizobium meliloti]RVH28158.1 hypothetical protein CN215_09845 [Sinorhizobium meliloti]RVH37685.1 hypothetical protein CN211_07545 [Sinorhizobium meliloti]RVQ41699.1 hypothetical protein CN068_07005 [Sinorhizobium meliloti]
MAFYADLSTSSDLEAVIKAAIHIEQEVLVVLNLELFDGAALDSLDLTYHQKTGLAIAVGLDPRFLKPMRTLGSIRNRFAHRSVTGLTKTDADNLYNSFDAFDKNVIQAAYAKMVSQGKVGERSTKFSGLTALDKFTLCVTTLRSALVSAQLDIIRNRRSH